MLTEGERTLKYLIWQTVPSRFAHDFFKQCLGYNGRIILFLSKAYESIWLRMNVKNAWKASIVLV